MERMWWIALSALIATACVDTNDRKDSTWTLSEDPVNSISTTTDNNSTTTSTTTSTTPSTTPSTTSSNTTSSNTTSSATSNTTNVTTGCLSHAPELHRPDPYECDDVRFPGAVPPPDDEWATCMTDADCVDGVNGRCIGNNHDSYYCTYDECFSDRDCGSSSVCECGGGWRSDHNVCLASNCAVDSDCGETGYCSPSQGDCGSYGGVVGYFCHRCADECMTDADCGNATGDEWGAYCRFDMGLGHWRCSETQCAG